MKRSEWEKIKKRIQPLVEERDELRDELGKVRQTTNGTGDAFDPIKYWKDGMAVEKGKWYQCYDSKGFIWEAIKSGVPKSSEDSDYFDVII